MMGKVTYASDGRHGNGSHNPLRLISRRRREEKEEAESRNSIIWQTGRNCGAPWWFLVFF